MNKNILKLASGLAEERLISNDVIMENLLDAIKHALSHDTGLSIEIEIVDETILVYTVRCLTENPIGTGEISKETILANMNKGVYPKIRTSDDFDNLQYGDFIKEKLDEIPTFDLSKFDRNTVNLINREFLSSISKIEKSREFERFKNKQGEVVSGTISQIQAGNFIVKLDGGEGFLSKNEIIPGEYFNFGDTVQVYIHEVRPEPIKYQIMLSRSRPEFIAGLMKMLFPEVQSNLIIIKGIARDEGNRCKIAVDSEQKNFDAAGSCIGRDGIRIKSLRALIANERVDIVRWDSNPAVFLENALRPIEAKKFIFHSENQVEIILNEENMIRAKSHRGNLIRLASILTKMRIIAISEEESDRIAMEEYNKSFDLFSNLGLTELQVRLLFSKGVTSIEEMLFAQDHNLQEILSESEEFVQKLKEKAEVSYNTYIEKEYKDAGVDVILSKIPGVMIHPSVFVDYKVHNVEDFAMLDSEEVASMLKDSCIDYGNQEDNLNKMAEDIVLWARSLRSK